MSALMDNKSLEERLSLIDKAVLYHTIIIIVPYWTIMCFDMRE